MLCLFDDLDHLRIEIEPSPAEDPRKLPRIFVSGETYPGAYELAIIALHKYGKESRTHYDQQDGKGKYLFSPSLEANVIVEINFAHHK